MAINFCKPCADACSFQNGVTSEQGFRQAVLAILCDMARGQGAGGSDTAINIVGTYNGANQVVVPAQVGKKIIITQLSATTEDASTDFQFFSRTGGGVNTAISPNYDSLSNAGLVLPYSGIGWIETLPGESLVITTSAAVDLLGRVVARA